MSPLPFWNVSDAERVHAPFTLSETCTWPVASNWPNQPTSRSPAPTGLDKVSWSELALDPGEAAIPCTKGGKVAATAYQSVEADRVAVPCWLPAALDRMSASSSEPLPALIRVV